MEWLFNRNRGEKSLGKFEKAAPSCTGNMRLAADAEIPGPENQVRRGDSWRPGLEQALEEAALAVESLFSIFLGKRGKRNWYSDRGNSLCSIRASRAGLIFSTEFRPSATSSQSILIPVSNRVGRRTEEARETTAIGMVYPLKRTKYCYPETAEDRSSHAPGLVKNVLDELSIALIGPVGRTGCGKECHRSDQCYNPLIGFLCLRGSEPSKQHPWLTRNAVAGVAQFVNCDRLMPSLKREIRPEKESDIFGSQQTLASPLFSPFHITWRT